MTLSPTDLNYIIHRMEMYDIKYQEVYDEIKDHVISAVEDMRAKGDHRNIVDLFDHMMNAQFPGYWAFERISKEYEKAYRQKVKKVIWANMLHYLNWQTIPLIVLAVIVGFYLPHDKRVSVVFMVVMVVTAMAPYFYVLRRANKIKPDAGKKSLVKNEIVRRAFLLFAITSFLLNVVGWIGRDFNVTYLNPRYFHPIFYIVLLTFFIIYGLSAMRLSRQELKLDHNQ
ncbi:MAG: hypothetical protein ACXVAY_09630 [Mucilaginibacter sp.]